MAGWSFGESGFVVAARARDSSKNQLGKVEATAMAAAVFRNLRRGRRGLFGGGRVERGFETLCQVFTPAS